MIINWFDIVILLIVVFSAVRGGMLGMIRSLVGLFSLIVAFFSANIYYDNFADIIAGKTNIQSSLEVFFSKDFFSKFSIPSIELPQLTKNFSEVSEYLDRLFVKSDFIADSLSASFGEFMSQILVNIISWVIIFVVVYIIIRVLGIILEEVFKLPLLKSINSITGFLFGIVKGTLFVLLLVLTLQFIGQISSNHYFSDLVENSYFAYYVIKYNIFRWIII